MKIKTVSKRKTKAVRLPIYFIDYLRRNRPVKGSFAKQILERFQEVPQKNTPDTDNTLSLF